MGKKGLIGLVVVIILVVLTVGYFGFIPGVSDIMGTNQPRDLGVKYSSADYASGVAKVPGLKLERVEGTCVTCNYSSIGSVPVKTAFTQEEFTAMMNAQNNTKGPLKNTQFKFNDDGTIEASGLIVDPQLTGAVFIKGKIVSASGKQVVMQIDSAELGRLPLPDDQKKIASDYVAQAISNYFAKNSGSSINSLSVSGGKIDFDGTLPQTVTGEA